MPAKTSISHTHTEYHKDGSIRARGRMVDGVLTGYWEWFRKDGTKMRSGNFQDGEQVGDWITYDQNGDVYKVTKKKLRVK
jgi:antitoxin component YwqK of YwqJK toxin-antitoxin module